jgi:hypothetical protein
MARPRRGQRAQFVREGQSQPAGADEGGRHEYWRTSAHSASSSAPLAESGFCAA